MSLVGVTANKMVCLEEKEDVSRGVGLEEKKREREGGGAGARGDVGGGAYRGWRRGGRGTCNPTGHPSLPADKGGGYAIGY